MYISSLQSVYFGNYHKNQTFRPTFEGRKIIDLNYVIKNRSELLPKRVCDKVNEIINSDSGKMPTLKQVHSEIYEPLMKCQTLEEAKELFPEFTEIKSADKVFKRNTGNIRKLTLNGYLNENLSLKLLQEVWVKLKSQDEIANELGLRNRSSLGWILKKINFKNYSSNYRTLLISSDPEGRAVIAAKTTAWNACHPDLMQKKNKYAAQFCKTAEYRKEHSNRMIDYDKLHPERKEKIREFNLAVWKKVPEIRKAMSNFARSQDSFTKLVISKEISGINLSPCENRIKKSFYKKFWRENPEFKKLYKEAYKQVREERAAKLK